MTLSFRTRISQILLFVSCSFAWADTVTLKDGSEVNGTVIEENANSVTLQLASGAKRVFRRADVEVVQIDKSRPKPAAVSTPVAQPPKAPVAPVPSVPYVAKPEARNQPAPFLPGKQPEPPQLPANSAFRADIYLKDGAEGGGGTASVVRLSLAEAPIFLTCYHLFGTATGLPRDIPAEKFDDEIREIRFHPIGETKHIGRAVGALVTNGYSFESGPGGDVAAFKIIEEVGVNVLDLATENPKPGEWLWIIGDELQSRPQQQRLRPIMVAPAEQSRGNGDLVFIPHTPFATRGFSGAPIINSKMEVVAVYGGRLGVKPDGTYTSLWGASALRVRELLAKSKK